MMIRSLTCRTHRVLRYVYWTCRTACRPAHVNRIIMLAPQCSPQSSLEFGLLPIIAAYRSSLTTIQNP